MKLLIGLNSPAILALVCTALPAQQWTDETLDSRIQGFLKPDTMSQLRQMAELVKEQDLSARAIAARIHGDHREYLLKVGRLVEQLTDRRWLEREHAERTLVEIGARARSLLEERRRTGEQLEERIRCERILQQINARGTEKDEQEIEMLRGLVATAAYLRSSETLRRALLSALGHTDPEVRHRAVRALGIHGTDDHIEPLQRLYAAEPGHRRAIRAAIARLEGPASLGVCAGWMRSDELALSDKVGLLRSLRQRGDTAALLESFARGDDSVLAEIARLELPPPEGTYSVQLTTPDGTVFDESFWGMSSDGTIISSPEAGLPRIEVPLDECNVLEFREPSEVRRDSGARVFLKRGSLVVGKLLSLEGDKLQFQSPVFGTVEIPRHEIQGIAVDPELERLIGASTAADRIRLTNQEIVEGECFAMDAEQVRLRNADGEKTIPTGEVAGVMFRRPVQTTPDTGLYARIDLVTGERIVGHLGAIHTSAVGIVSPPLGTAKISLDQVVRIEMNASGGALWGFTLIADYSDNTVVEVDEQGDVVFRMDEIYGAWDAECLDSGNLLLTEFSVSRVQEVTRDGKTVWSYEDLRNPYDADRLPNGNTLIANTFAGQVIEVSPDGEIVWKYDDGIRPFDVDRLPNGNTLIADVMKDRVIEVTRDGAIVWEKKGLQNVHDADRLHNGNTLITLRTKNLVIEVDPNGNEVFRLENLNAPSDADRMPNGNTLVAENNMAREFDRKGKVVWKKDMTWAVEVNRY